MNDNKVNVIDVLRSQEWNEDGMGGSVVADYIEQDGFDLCSLSA